MRLVQRSSAWIHKAQTQDRDVPEDEMIELTQQVTFIKDDCRTKRL